MGRFQLININHVLYIALLEASCVDEVVCLFVLNSFAMCGMCCLLSDWSVKWLLYIIWGSIWGHSLFEKDAVALLNIRLCLAHLAPQTWFHAFKSPITLCFHTKGGEQPWAWSCPGTSISRIWQWSTQLCHGDKQLQHHVGKSQVPVAFTECLCSTQPPSHCSTLHSSSFSHHWSSFLRPQGGCQTHHMGGRVGIPSTLPLQLQWVKQYFLIKNQQSEGFSLLFPCGCWNWSSKISVIN